VLNYRSYKLRNVFYVLVSLWFLSVTLWAATLQEGILFGGTEGKREFLDVISKSQSDIIVVTYKVHQSIPPDPEFLEALRCKWQSNNAPCKGGALGQMAK
jgi:hypothetical protein